MTTGILSLQGNFLDHTRSLELIKKDYILIKQKNDLKSIDSLILPGGESTSMIKIQSNNELFKELKILINDGIPTIGIMELNQFVYFRQITRTPVRKGSCRG